MPQPVHFIIAVRNPFPSSRASVTSTFGSAPKRGCGAIPSAAGSRTSPGFTVMPCFTRNSKGFM
ncbi:MAG TPA: hypothetical protein VD838_13235 [Anaeromyxobacteraceae bacterium]|nr:hypothetical protein [Anaeromyxobacteraceae bacterium]